MNGKKIFARNVRALMARSKTLRTQGALAAKAKAKAGTRKIKQSTIQYLLDDKDPRNPQLDTIEAIAEALGVRAWMLLDPNFDPDSRTGGKLPPDDVLRLAEYIISHKDTLRDVSNWSAALKKLLEPSAESLNPQELSATRPTTLAPTDPSRDKAVAAPQ